MNLAMKLIIFIINYYISLRTDINKATNTSNNLWGFFLYQNRPNNQIKSNQITCINQPLTILQRLKITKNMFVAVSWSNPKTEAESSFDIYTRTPEQKFKSTFSNESAIITIFKKKYLHILIIAFRLH